MEKTIPRRGICSTCGHAAKHHFPPRPAATDTKRLEACGVRGQGHGWQCPCPEYTA